MKSAIIYHLFFQVPRCASTWIYETFPPTISVNGYRFRQNLPPKEVITNQKALSLSLWTSRPAYRRDRVDATCDAMLAYSTPTSPASKRSCSTSSTVDFSKYVLILVERDEASCLSLFVVVSQATHQVQKVWPFLWNLCYNWRSSTEEEPNVQERIEYIIEVKPRHLHLLKKIHTLKFISIEVGRVSDKSYYSC
jgi:hypothetical protein